MNIKDLPTEGNYYGSGEAITEFCHLVDEVMNHNKSRCDCDSSKRCQHCIMESELSYRKVTLKKKITDLIKEIEKVRETENGRTK